MVITNICSAIFQYRRNSSSGDHARANRNGMCSQRIIIRVWHVKCFFRKFLWDDCRLIFRKHIGSSIVQKYGRFVGLTEKRWRPAGQKKYKKNIKRTIISAYICREYVKLILILLKQDI